MLLARSLEGGSKNAHFSYLQRSSAGGTHAARLHRDRIYLLHLQPPWNMACREIFKCIFLITRMGNACFHPPARARARVCVYGRAANSGGDRLFSSLYNTAFRSSLLSFSTPLTQVDLFTLVHRLIIRWAKGGLLVRVIQVYQVSRCRASRRNWTDSSSVKKTEKGTGIWSRGRRALLVLLFVKRGKEKKKEKKYAQQERNVVV